MILMLLLKVFYRQRRSYQLRMMVFRALLDRSAIYIVLRSFACACGILFNALLNKL